MQAYAFAVAQLSCIDRQSQTIKTQKKCSRVLSRREVCQLAIAAVSVAGLRSLPAKVQAEQIENMNRNDRGKELFAKEMDVALVEYEKLVSARKKELFSKVSRSDTIVDIGVGTGPNFQYLPKGSQVIGIDPNPYMWPYAKKKALTCGIDLELIDGSCENMPFEDDSVDVIITTLMLCSVPNEPLAIDEILRVLKPGGIHIFVEHVLASKKRPFLRLLQTVFNPLQNRIADGCNVTRDTEKYLREAKDPGYSELYIDNFDVKYRSINDLFNIFSPQISGYGRKAHG